MKIILIGYPGSQQIVPASKYLTGKYLSGKFVPDFDIIYLNYEGPIKGWAHYMSDYLSTIYDKHIIFSLDDYLISGIDISQYRLAETYIRYHSDIKCIKLCYSTPEEHIEYPCTTQYTIWDRDYLIYLLVQTQSPIRTPWEFEILGSQVMKKSMQVSCIEYFTNSSLSAKWEGVNLTGLKEEDINYLKENNLI